MSIGLESFVYFLEGRLNSVETDAAFTNTEISNEKVLMNFFAFGIFIQ